MPPRRPPARSCGAACAAALLSKQQRIDDALRNNSWAPVRRDAFHPYERCLLEASEARLTYDEHDRQHAESICSIHLEGNATSFLETCGVGTATVRPGHNTRRGACLYAPMMPLHARSSLLSRHAALPLPGEYGSHLVRALRNLLPRHQTLEVLGDSLARQTVAAAHCDLQRHLTSGRSRARALKHVNLGTLGERGWDTSARRVARRVEAALDPVIAAATRAGGGTILVVTGTHFNDADREAFRSIARAVVAKLDAFAASCARCVAMVATTATQHFPTSGGEYQQAAAAWAINDSARAAADLPYPCRAIGTSAAPSPNVWRAAEWRAAAAELKARHLLFFPLDAATRHAWDAHFGYGKFQGRGVDCTHFCNGPFLFEPLWWALAEATSHGKRVES